MGKRRAEEEIGPSQPRPPKRQRQGGRIKLFNLSDELLLRCLSSLPIESLTSCELTCRKLRDLARDNSIWREKYYNRFVRHRARRLPSLRNMDPDEREEVALKHSSKRARWLEHAHLLDADADTHWRHVYKVKHNWKRGRARKSELQIQSQPKPVALARACCGTLFTADLDHGLRAWRRGVVLQTCASGQPCAPSAMAVQVEGDTRVCVGYENGAVCLFTTKETKGATMEVIVQPGSAAVECVDIVWPYVLVLSGSQIITLLQIASEAATPRTKCLATLHSGSALSTAALSLRRTRTALVAGVTYAFNRFNAGWCLGLQEIRMGLDGTITNDRTTSSDYVPVQKPSITSRSASTAPFSLHPQLMRAPNSLSFCGCYILAGLPDNTLMVYTVTSTEERLEIGTGRRLWGHTSAISAAEVTSTGKAVSISSMSEETRYWELEEVLASSSSQRTSVPIESIELGRLKGAIDRRGDGVGLAMREMKREEQLVRHFVSFDDEQAIVVGERDQRQVISRYDFA